MPDHFPIVLCRVDIPPNMQADVDAWMPKHFDDALAHPAVMAAANFAVRRDWDRLPSVFNNDATRFIPYAYESVDGLVAAIDGPEARGAIEDGAEREAQYPLLDDEPFNGTTLEVVEVRGACGAAFAGRGPILAERFQVDEAHAEEFDRWLNGPYLDRAASWPGLVRVRTFSAAAGLPQRWPHARYQGKGNRMIWAEFEEAADLDGILGSRSLGESLSDSVQWDVRLPYVRRDAADCLLVRTKADLES